MSTPDSSLVSLIADWEASLRSAYAYAGQLTGDDATATAVLMAALDDAFAERPNTAPGRRELLGRIAAHATPARSAMAA